MAVYEVCFRAREGLPLPTRRIIKLVIDSALARTQRDDKVIICDYLWMANHPHILLISQDVTALKNFYGELKKRITDMLKRMLGLDALRLWEEKGARVMQILDLEKAKRQLAYYFLNPVTAGLVDSIDHYPGESTWRAFCTCEPRVDAFVETTVPWIRLPSIPTLRTLTPTVGEETQVINQIKAANKRTESFRVHPLAWLKVFGITEPDEIEAIRQEIIALVRAGEQECRERRQKERKQLRGAVKLLLEGIMLTGHKPAKRGRSVFFLSSIKELRIGFHAKYRDFCERCRECYLLACRGVKDLVWPDGAFVPPILPLVNPIEVLG